MQSAVFFQIFQQSHFDSDNYCRYTAFLESIYIPYPEKIKYIFIEINFVLSKARAQENFFFAVK